MKIINKATFIPLSQVTTKLDSHIQTMNADDWELMSVAVEIVGIDEHFILFWRKALPNTITDVKVTS